MGSINELATIHPQRALRHKSLVPPCFVNQLLDRFAWTVNERSRIERFIVWWPPRARERPKTVTLGKRSPRTISIPALPLSVAAFCGAKKCNPCLRKVLLGQGEWPVALQDTPDRDLEGISTRRVGCSGVRTAVPRSLQPCAPQNPSAGEYVETRGYCPADDRCKIVPCYTSFDPRGRK